jgi:hypothetical protein
VEFFIDNLDKQSETTKSREVISLIYGRYSFYSRLNVPLLFGIDPLVLTQFPEKVGVLILTGDLVHLDKPRAGFSSTYRKINDLFVPLGGARPRPILQNLR